MKTVFSNDDVESLREIMDSKILLIFWGKLHII